MACTFRILASPLHDDDAVTAITSGLRRRLADLGGIPGEPEDEPTLPFLIVIATGGTEAAVLEMAARRRAVSADPAPEVGVAEPVTLVAHPWHNSLPAALEALARLHRDGVRGRIVYIDPDRADDGLAVAVADAAAVLRMRRTRLGLVGEPSGWLVASVPDRDAVRRRWGVELVPVPMEQVIAMHDPAGGTPVRWLRRSDQGFGHLPDAEVVAAAALRPTLTAVLERHRVDAVTVRCFDFLTDLHTSGCLALAELNDDGIVAGCEGDVAAAVAMLWIRHLLDRPSWIANPAQVDPGADEVLLAHCTIAPSLVEDLDLHTHFESGIGVGIHGAVPPGPVTLVRLGGGELEHCWLADGVVVGGGGSPDLCRTQARVRLGSGRVQELLDHPLGNHLVLARGHHADRMGRWWRTAIG